jgi:polysaccharide export outer membrane protein
MKRAIGVALFLLTASAPAFPQDKHDALLAGQDRYRLQPGDVFDVQYRLSPEFNQSVTVQPDGFVMLQIAGEVQVAGLTAEQTRLEVAKQSQRRLRDPEVAVMLKDFQKPSFIVEGEVAKPGKFELRGHVTALEAIAVAGGFTPASKHSQVLLVRRLDADRAEVTPIDLKNLERHPKQADEYRLAPGDMLIVPKNAVSKIERIVRWTSVGVFWNPLTR